MASVCSVATVVVTADRVSLMYELQNLMLGKIL